jgi:hypothetical protein
MNIIYAVKNQIGVYHEAQALYCKSQYLQNYQRNLEQISERKAWKLNGLGAQYRGDAASKVDTEGIIERAQINGVSFVQQDKVLYSISVEEFSGIFMKNPLAAEETEDHVIHDNKTGFFALDYNQTTGETVVALQHSTSRNLALLDIHTSRYRLITEGDSIDDNPVWSKKDHNIIFYDSRGIGRTQHGVMAEIGPAVINRLDMKSGELQEVISVNGYDCFLPKTDEKGHLYFIKKPHEKKSGSCLKDILLIPFRISKAIYKWIEWFTIMHTGQPLTSGGDNPAKQRDGNDLKTIIINGNIINADKAYKENCAKKEKFPGIAPHDWELVRLEFDGKLTTIKKGVVDFEITRGGEILYSNGRHLIKIDASQHEVLLATKDLIHKVKAW